VTARQIESIIERHHEVVSTEFLLQAGTLERDRGLRVHLTDNH
jgi:hypothetical protein